MGAARALIASLALVSAAAAGCAARELPPLGEALVVVDTDLPMPRVVSALRVDLYAIDGTWLDSRDVGRPDPRDWPVSFSVQAADDRAERDVVVRLRAHGARLRDAVGPARLVVDGADETPSSEPEPALTVDRLVLIRLRPGERGRLRVVARASCAGVEARVVPGALASCAEGEGALEPVAAAALEPELSTPPTSVAGSAARTPCPAPIGERDRACLEGGAFVLGADDVSVVPDPTVPLAPERIARVRGFLLDREEVTVARFRDALARGFVPPEPPVSNDGELGAAPETACTFSAAPRGREAFALTCVTWATARALCTFDGGDLPTEAQWEYAATSAGRTAKATFPWGEEPPDCGRAVYGRLELAGIAGACEAAGSGPLPSHAAPADRSPAGVHALGGGVAEWVRDAPTTYDDPCHARIDASCARSSGGAHVVRGGAWASTAINVRSTARLAATGPSSFIGFRCVQEGSR